MVAKIKVEDLPPEVLRKLGIEMPGNDKAPKLVKPRVVAMGGVLLALKGLTNREALWVLRVSTILVRGYRTDKKANPHTTAKERKRRTVVERQ